MPPRTARTVIGRGPLGVLLAGALGLGAAAGYISTQLGAAPWMSAPLVGLTSGAALLGALHRLRTRTPRT